MSLPENIEKELAIFFLANIIELSETEEGQKMFENWKKREDSETGSSDAEDDC